MPRHQKEEGENRRLIDRFYYLIQDEIKAGVDVPSPGYGCSTKDALISRGVDSSLVLMLYLKNGTKKIGTLAGCNNDAEAMSAIYETAQCAKDLNVTFYTQRGVLLSRETPEVSKAICDLVTGQFPEMQLEVHGYSGKMGNVRLNLEEGEWQVGQYGTHAFAQK